MSAQEEHQHHYRLSTTLLDGTLIYRCRCGDHYRQPPLFRDDRAANETDRLREAIDAMTAGMNRVLENIAATDEAILKALAAAQSGDLPKVIEILEGLTGAYNPHKI